MIGLHPPEGSLQFYDDIRLIFAAVKFKFVVPQSLPMWMKDAKSQEYSKGKHAGVWNVQKCNYNTPPLQPNQRWLSKPPHVSVLLSLLHCQCRSSKDAFQYSWPVIANLAKNAHPQQCEFVSMKPLDNQFVHFVPVATNRTGNECVLMVIIR